MRITIKDIAADTGLSVTSVSLILNGKAKKIPRRTKDLVFNSAEKLGYRPNQLAVGLVKKQTKTLGLVISDIRNLFFATLAKGVEDECHRNGWAMILCNTNDVHQRDIEYIKLLSDKGVDGILYCMSFDTQLEMAKKCCSLMESLQIPFVMIDRYFECLNYTSVIVDHKLGGYLATKHLIELGHKRIACVTGPLHLDDSINRLKGYRQALTEHGLDYDSDIIYEGRYSIDSGSNAMESLYGKDFTAIFAFNDMTALGVVSQAKKLNVKIPEELALVGYDDIYFTEIMENPLTTIHQPVYEMGIEGTKKLLSVINGEDSTEKYVIFAPRLVVRKSSVV